MTKAGDDDTASWQWPDWSPLRPVEKIMYDGSNPKNPCIITSMFGFREEDCVTFEWMRNSVAPVLDRHPRFRSVVKSRPLQGGCEFVKCEQPASDAGRPYQVDDHCFLEPAFGSVGEEKPMNEMTPAERVRVFCDRMGALGLVSFAPGRPMWSLHLFQGFALNTVDNRGATIVLRVHHVLSDGIALVKLLVEDARGHHNDFGSVIPVPRRQRTGAEPRSAVADLQPGNVVGSLLQRSWRFVTDAWDILVATVVAPDQPTILTTAPMCGRRVCYFSPPSAMSVTQLETASRQLGVTINDMLLSAFTGAMREYLVRHGGGTEHLPDPGRFHVACPMNAHLVCEPQVNIWNDVRILPVAVPLFEQDPVQRLRNVSSHMTYLKNGYRFGLIARALKLASLFPSSLRVHLWNRMSRRASAVFSNVPGPTEPLQLAGKTVDSVSVVSPPDANMGLTFSAITYADRCGFSISGDAQRIQHPDELCQLVFKELERLFPTTAGSQ